ncbi:MAG: hypothetical protein QOI53_2124 [Verrucomicrobiota bacterium]|jgi:hypothetical protein|nr:hypothetical protein [Acidobacteriaceae bacterium]MEA3146595.1 hypothetical protein [Verrucomicrobiota bacterium]
MSAGSTVITKRDTRDVGISGEATNEIGKSLKALLTRLGFCFGTVDAALKG